MAGLTKNPRLESLVDGTVNSQRILRWRAYDCHREGVNGGSTIPIKEGGIMLDFDDEDPQIQKDFQSALKQVGIS